MQIVLPIPPRVGARRAEVEGGGHTQLHEPIVELMGADIGDPFQRRAEHQLIAQLDGVAVRAGEGVEWAR